MKRNILFLAVLVSLTASTSAFAQTAETTTQTATPAKNPIFGKWKLVGVEKDGKPKSVKSLFYTEDVYQVFREDGAFESIIKDLTYTGTWSIDTEGKYLTVTANAGGKPMTNVFDIIKTTDTERVIHESNANITLTYVKQ